MKKSMVFEGVTATLLLLLVFLMLAMLLGGNAGKLMSGTTQYIYTGNDGTLYSFTGRDIQAIDGAGNVLWNYLVPEQWNVSYGWYYYPEYTSGFNSDTYDTSTPYNITARTSSPIMFSDNGTLYVYLKANDVYSATSDVPENGLVDGKVIAISKDGMVLWSLPIQSMQANFSPAGLPENPPGGLNYSDAQIYAQGGRVYVFHDYNETVVDDGNILWSIGNVSDPAAVDGDGYVYCVPSSEPDMWYSQPFSPYRDVYTGAAYVNITDYRVPSAIIDAYYPNGTLYWREYPGELMYRQYIGRSSLPLYNNGTIYAPLYDGIMALCRNGSVEWIKKLNPNDYPLSYSYAPNLTRYPQGDFRLYDRTQFGSKGDVYMEYISRYALHHEKYLIILGPDSRELSHFLIPHDYISASDGIAYATDYPYESVTKNLTALETGKLIVYDLMSGRELWNYTFRVDDPVTVTIDENNVRDMFPYGSNLINEYRDADIQYGPLIRTFVQIPEVLAGNGHVYAYFRSFNYQSPVILGQSKCAYVSEVYDFYDNGTIVWNKTISPGANSLNVAGNGTIYFLTNGGKLVVTGAGLATGFTLTALAYIFFRFFCIGAAARARARLSKNDNRNLVYDFIVQNPGSTLHEIARGTGMNAGTVRYHLFILGMNHKIISSRMDGKYIRHFTNSNTYSKEEQFIMSLVRRGTLGKVLAIMLEKPGISNVQISKELGITESEVSRYLSELAKKDIVVKAPAGIERAYVIEEGKRERILSVIKRLDAPDQPVHLT